MYGIHIAVFQIRLRVVVTVMKVMKEVILFNSSNIYHHYRREIVTMNHFVILSLKSNLILYTRLPICNLIYWLPAYIKIVNASSRFTSCDVCGRFYQFIGLPHLQPYPVDLPPQFGYYILE